MSKLWTFLFRGMAFLLFAGTLVLQAGEPPDAPKKPSPPGDEGAFQLETSADVLRIKRLRRGAIEEYITILERRWRDEKPSEELNRRATMAADLLGELRASDSGSIYVLCQNIAMHRTGEPWKDGVSPSINLGGAPTSFRLAGYPAMSALRRIGGPEVFAGILGYMNEPRSREELMFCACALDPFEEERLIVLARIKLAEEETTKKALRSRGGWNDLQANLAELRKILEDPEIRRKNPHFIPGGPPEDY
ncbi:MAG: hypothetical protein ACR2FY_20805 [Pirellulaceae bacterium]